jgi:hypothetical protein
MNRPSPGYILSAIHLPELYDGWLQPEGPFRELLVVDDLCDLGDAEELPAFEFRRHVQYRPYLCVYEENVVCGAFQRSITAAFIIVGRMH